MPARGQQNFLRTTPIPPHVAPVFKHPKKPFGKPGSTFGDPVAAPKPFPQFIPPPPPSTASFNLSLETVLPEEAKAANNTGVLIFHSVGDTGGIHGDNVEKSISDAMDQQITDAVNAKAPTPAFYYNLGDVVYFNGESNLYNSQFYEPYQSYHGAIFAIAGNHDGDNVAQPPDPPDPESSLFGFMKNFCDTASHYNSPYRPTMTQPYVYWTFDTPFVTIIGLYSNVDGLLDARGTSQQQQWFQNQMASAPSDKALIVTVHHPPYSLDTVHRGYPDIETSIDRAIQATGRVPTAVMNGHVHSYQRYERALSGKKVPYVIAGAGGYANTAALLHQIETTAKGKPLPDGFQTTHPDLKLMKHNDKQPGFLRVTVDGNKKTLTFEYFLVPFTGNPPAKPFDTATVPW